MSVRVKGQSSPSFLLQADTLFKWEYYYFSYFTLVTYKELFIYFLNISGNHNQRRGSSKNMIPLGCLIIRWVLLPLIICVLRVWSFRCAWYTSGTIFKAVRTAISYSNLLLFCTCDFGWSYFIAILIVFVLFTLNQLKF